MQKTDLQGKHCIPCEGTENPFTTQQIQTYMPALSLPWALAETNTQNTGAKKITHQFTFKSFPDAVAFVNKIVPIAEGEGHHPDLHIYYNKVLVELWTHAIGGLSENDFIVAVKIESII